MAVRGVVFKVESGEEVWGLFQAREDRNIDVRDYLDKIWWGCRPPIQLNVKEASNLGNGSINLPMEK